MNEIDLSKFNIRTDLIIDDDNISHNTENINGIEITRSNDSGNYITLSFDDVTDHDNGKMLCEVFTNIIRDILKLNKIKDDDSCLIIGLGNAKSTPDSLGVKVLDNIIVTAHLFALGKVASGMRKVSCVTPGVMANTGIESAKIIKAIIDKIKPNFVIAIDALASRTIERINKTIQITDTGIHPGSGIGNNRVEISKKTMHIPVIAIGVPTVATSSTIVYDTLNYLIKHISYIKEYEGINKLIFNRTNYLDKIKDKELSNVEKENLLGLFGNLDNVSKRNLIEEVLNNIELNMIVTPTEIDFLIDKLSNIIAKSLNNALHQEI